MIVAAAICAVAGGAFALNPVYFSSNELRNAPKFLFLAIGTSIALIDWMRSPHRIVRLGWFELSLAFYFAVGAMSCLLHDDNFTDSTTWLAVGGGTALLCLAINRRARTDERYQSILLQIVIAVALVLAAVAALEALGVSLPWVGTRRPHSTLGNRNHLGGYLAIVLPIALFRQLRRPSIFGGLAVFVTTTILILTRCRSAWLGLLVAAAVSGLVIYRLRNELLENYSFRAAIVRAGVPFLLAIGAATFVPWPGLHWKEDHPLLSSASRMFETEEGTTGRMRIDQHRIGAAIVAEHPFFGVGPRQWDDAAFAHAHIVPRNFVVPYYADITPQSDLLRVVAEKGILGLLAALAAVAALISELRRALRNRNDFALRLALLGSLTVFTIHALLDVPLFRPESLALIAVLAAVAHVPAPFVSLRISWTLRRVLLSVCIVGILAIAGLRALSAYVITAGKDSLAAEKEAVKFYPRIELVESYARMLVGEGQCKEAEPELKRILSWSPHRLAGFGLQYRCALISGDQAKAEELRFHMLELEPDLPDGLF